MAPLSATGSVVPSPTIISLLANTAIAVIAPVPEPINIPPSVRVETPVPPSATTKSVIPVTAPPVIVILAEAHAPVIVAVVPSPEIYSPPLSSTYNLSVKTVSCSKVISVAASITKSVQTISKSFEDGEFM